MNPYTFKESQIDDTTARLFSDGCASLTISHDEKAPDDPIKAFDAIRCVGSWANSKSNPDCPAFVRKAFGVRYEHKDEQEPEYMRVCDWVKRGQKQEAIEGRR
jgi:hypothetical protein